MKVVVDEHREGFARSVFIDGERVGDFQASGDGYHVVLTSGEERPCSTVAKAIEAMIDQSWVLE